MSSKLKYPHMRSAPKSGGLGLTLPAAPQTAPSNPAAEIHQRSSAKARVLHRLARDVWYGDRHTATLAWLLLRALNKDPKVLAPFRKKPGPKARHTERNFRVALSVTRLRAQGLKQHQAIMQVAEEEFGSTADAEFDLVEKIYKQSVRKSPHLHALLGHCPRSRRPRS